MKRFLFPICILVSLFVLSWGFLLFGTGRGYTEYKSGVEYRRLHPELIPSPTLVKLFDMGHTNSYASFTWLQLVQYIGDNIWGNRFLDFSHAILEHITILHPYFIKPYEIDLILAPTSLGENMTAKSREYNKIYSANSINLGKKGMDIFCDKNKIEEIKKRTISENLWNDTSLKDPCASGTLPYYIAFVTYQMGDKKAESSEYYKIASMNNDAPNASKILGVLALSAEGDYLATALNFALIGSTGYDIEPYTCHDLTIEIIKDITSKRPLNKKWLQELIVKKNNLKNNKDPKNVISGAADNCYDMSTRSIETLYLNYIANIAKNTIVKNENDLIKLGLLKNTETDMVKKGFTTYKKEGIWQFKPKIN